jgi:hypothetical protein
VPSYRYNTEQHTGGRIEEDQISCYEHMPLFPERILITQSSSWLLLLVLISCTSDAYWKYSALGNVQRSLSVGVVVISWERFLPASWLPAVWCSNWITEGASLLSRWCSTRSDVTSLAALRWSQAFGSSVAVPLTGSISHCLILYFSAPRFRIADRFSPYRFYITLLDPIFQCT